MRRTPPRNASLIVGLTLTASALTLSSPALAGGISCDETMSMVEAGLDEAMVVAAMRSGGEMDASTVTCLVERNAPAAVVVTAQELADDGAAPPAAASAPAEPEEAAAPPPESTNAAPAAAPPAPQEPLAPGYKKAAFYAGGGLTCFAVANFARGKIKEGVEAGATSPDPEAAAMAHNVVVALGYAGVGIGAVIALKTRKELTMSTQLLPQGGGLTIGGVW